MMPILFISDIEANRLIDSAAIGDEANPFRSKLSAWDELGLLRFIDDVDTGRWCGWQNVKGTGPDGTSGLAFRVLPQRSQQEAAPVFGPDTKWIRASERVWFSDSRPEPSDLLRYSVPSIPSHPVMLSDGQVWEIPRIRRPITGGYVTPPEHNQSELPQRVRRTWDGELILEPSPAWSDLWNQSLRFASSLWGDQQGITYEELLNFALRIMQLRYRYTDLVSRAFPDALEVESLWKIAKAACGWDLVEAELQKKRQAGEAESSQ